MTRYLSLLLVLFLTGCFSIAKVSVVPNYQTYVKRIAVLSFDVHGNPAKQFDESAADHLGTAIMDDGITVIDRKFVEAEAGRDGIDLHHIGSVADLDKLAKSLNIDAFFLGTMEYAYEGPSAGTTPTDIETKTDKKGKVVDVSVSGGGSYASAGGYLATGMSARLVSTRDYVTLVSAYVPGDNAEAMIAEIRKKMKVDN